MTCKDCIYEKMCCKKHDWLKSTTPTQIYWEYEEQNLTTAYHCRQFKDKSDYVSFSECNKRIREYFKSVIDSGEYIIEVTDANADIQRILEGTRE